MDSVDSNSFIIWRGAHGWKVTYPASELAIKAYHWFSHVINYYALEAGNTFEVYGTPIANYDQLIGRFLSTVSTAGLVTSKVSRVGMEG